MNSCFNSCCNCSKDHYYIGPTGCTGATIPNGETGPALSIAIPTCRLN